MSFAKQTHKEVRPMMAFMVTLIPLERRETKLLARFLLVLLIGVALLGVLSDGHLYALKAAGAFNGTPISGVQTYVDKLKENLIWLGSTAMGLVIAVVAIMFMAGHSRAHDIAIKTIAGLGILASIGGIVA